MNSVRRPGVRSAGPLAARGIRKLPRTWVYRLLALGVAMLAALGGCGGESRDEEALRALREGAELQAQGNLRRAGDAFTYALRADPELAEAWAGRAYVFYSYTNMEKALEDLAVATSLDPDLSIAYNYRGLVYTALGDLDRAMLNFTKAVELDPSSGEALHNRAMASLSADDVDAAIADMSAVIDLDPEAPRYYVERARLHLLAGDTQRARGDLEQVLGLTQDETWVLPARELLWRLGSGATP